jgi:hypothetical protein
VQRHRIDEADIVSELRQPLGVDTRPPANIKDLQLVVREKAQDQLLGSGQLQGTRRKAPREALGFLALLVVSADLGRQRGHVSMVDDRYLLRLRLFASHEVV